MFIQTESTTQSRHVEIPAGSDRSRIRFLQISRLRPAQILSRPGENVCSGLKASKACFWAPDFITVTKDDQDWAHLKPAILGRDHGTFHIWRPR